MTGTILTTRGKRVSQALSYRPSGQVERWDEAAVLGS